MFFVIYSTKPYSSDVNDWSCTLHRMTEVFDTLEKATSFVGVWRNKGYYCTIYQGTELNLT